MVVSTGNCGELCNVLDNLMHMNETSNSDKIIETLSGDRNWGVLLLLADKTKNCNSSPQSGWINSDGFFVFLKDSHTFVIRRM